MESEIIVSIFVSNEMVGIYALSEFGNFFDINLYSASTEKAMQCQLNERMWINNQPY